MKAAILRGANQPFSIEELIVDNLGPMEVRVRTAASGLCHSDFHYVTGDMPGTFPMVLGHEAAGMVDAVGSQVTRFKPGDHVVTCASLHCGQCRTCMRGWLHRCASKPVRAPQSTPRTRIGNEPVFLHTGIGGHAQMLLVHQNSLALLPRDMPFDRAAVLGCAVVTGVGAAINSAKIAPGDTVAVIGCGGVGLNVIQGARICGAETIIAIDKNPTKLELARRFGATDVVVGGPDAVDAVMARLPAGVDHVLEVVGLTQTIQQGFRMLASGGVLTLVGVPPMDASLTLPGPVVGMLMKELRVQGSIMGSSVFPIDIPRYASLYLQGKLELDLLVSQRIALSDVNQGYKGSPRFQCNK